MTHALVPANPLYPPGADPSDALKPSYDNMPAHLRIDLSSCFKAGRGMFQAELRILPVDAYVHIFDPPVVQPVKPVPPGTPTADNDMKAKFSAIAKWGLDSTGRARWQLIAPIDESPIALIGARRWAAAGFTGGRVLTDYTPDADFLRSGRLTYLYQGFDRGYRHILLLSVPVFDSGLATSDAKTHWGFTLQQLWREPAALAEYQASANTWYVRQERNLRPSMSELDGIVDSVVAR